MPRGGFRPGSGPKKGAPSPVTADKVALRKKARALIAPHLKALIESQISNAKGLSYLVYRDKKTGKFERVKNIDAVDQDAEKIEVWEKDPSVQAFTDLMNRCLDKPAEHHEISGADGGPIEVVTRLTNARKRLAERK